MTDEIKADVNQASSAESKPVERMIPQSRVDELLHERTKAVAAKAREQALAEAQAQHAAAQASQSMGGMHSMSPEQLHKMVAEATQKHLQDHAQQQAQLAQQAQGKQIADEFNSKIAAAKSRIPDYDETIGQLDMREIPHVAYLANGVDNTADVIHELAKNPSKIASLTTLMHTSPKLAQQEMARLSQSIKVNQQAAATKQASDPLSSIQPSTTGTDNGSPSSIKDLRKQPWMRG